MAEVKALVVFYSRTGITRKVAEAIAAALSCDCEEIIDTKAREGLIHYCGAIKDAIFKRRAPIAPPQRNPAEYELVILGTPVWAWTLSCAMRTYIQDNRAAFRTVAFFCTMGGSGDKSAFKVMGMLCGKDPVATLSLTESEVRAGDFGTKVAEFVKALRV